MKKLFNQFVTIAASDADIKKMFRVIFGIIAGSLIIAAIWHPHCIITGTLAYMMYQTIKNDK